LALRFSPTEGSLVRTYQPRAVEFSRLSQLSVNFPLHPTAGAIESRETLSDRGAFQSNFRSAMWETPGHKSASGGSFQIDTRLPEFHIFPCLQWQAGIISPDLSREENIAEAVLPVPSQLKEPAC
jgi:hypothetical protein